MDGVCAAALFGPLRGRIDPSQLFLLYNTLAFSTQCLVGLAADRIRRHRLSAAAAALCVAAGFALPLLPLLRLLLIGLGNSVFHVAAGTETLERSGGRAAPLGVFVAPGAVGLSLGTLFPALGPVPAGLLALAAIASLFLKAPEPEPTAWADRSDLRTNLPYPEKPEAPLRRPLAAAVLLTLAVGVRAVGGAAVSFPWQTGPWLALLTTGFVFAGKTAGGFLCDRVGPRRAAWLSVPPAALLIAFCGSWMLPALLGQLALNLTMPVTLWLLYRALPESPGFAFGLAASALWPGTLAGKYIQLTGPARWVLLLLCFLFGLFAILYSAPRRDAAGSAPGRAR